MSLFVHLEELIGAVRPGTLSRFIETPVSKLLLKRIEGCVIRRVEVSRLVKSLLVHRQFFDPPLGVNVSHLRLRVHHNLVYGVPIR